MRVAARGVAVRAEGVTEAAAVEAVAKAAVRAGVVMAAEAREEGAREEGVRAGGLPSPPPAPMLSRAIANPQVVRGEPWTSRRSMRRLTRCVLIYSATRLPALPPQRAPLVARTA